MSWMVAHSFIGSFGLEDSQNIEYLQKVGCQTHHSQADADHLIVQTAVESARRANTVLVGDDTDPLILLCCYTELSALELFSA